MTPQNEQPRALSVITQEDAAMVGLPTPEALRLLKSFADNVTGTPFFPKGLGDNPATILSVVLTGREMGLQPMEAIGSFYLSPGGRLGMYAEAMGARLLKAKFKIKILKREKWDGAIEITPPNGDPPTTWTFNEEDGRTAGLLPAKADSNWIKYPRNMPIWRCEADAYRFYRGLIPGGNGGVSLSAEELQDMDHEAPAAPGETAEAPKLEVIAGRRRKDGKDGKEPAADIVTVEATAETVRPVTTEDPLKGTVAADPALVTKTSEEFLIRCGEKLEKQNSFQTASLRMVGMAKENPGLPVYVDRVDFYSNGTSKVTVVANTTDTADGIKVNVQAAVGTETRPVEDGKSDAIREQIKARAMQVYASIPVEPKNQKVAGDGFLCGFFGVPVPKQWPKDATKRAAGVDALENAVMLYPDKFRTGGPAGVRQLGVDSAKNTVADDSAPLYKEMGWSPETAAIARKARLSLQHDASDFSDWVGFFKLGQLDEKDAGAFLACAAASGRGTNNLKNLMGISEKLGKSYSSITDSIASEYGKPIIELNGNQISEALSFIEKAVEQKQATPATSPEQEQAPTEPAASDGEWD